MVVANKRTHVIRFRVTSWELDWARTIAEENGQPLSSVIRQALGTFVADYAESIEGFPVSTPCAPPQFRMR